MSDRDMNKLLQPLNEAPPAIKKIIERVLKLEHEKIYEMRPRLNADIIKIVKEEVS